jgi:pyridoxine 5-phosphate synthase
MMCIDAGTGGITVHSRPDQRYIRASNCIEVAAMLDVELNIEGNPFTPPMKRDQVAVTDCPGFLELVKQIKPAQCTLVPNKWG